RGVALASGAPAARHDVDRCRYRWLARAAGDRADGAARAGERAPLSSAARTRAAESRPQRRGGGSGVSRLPGARAFARRPERIYVVTLSFALLMALFVAVAVAVTQSRLLAEPLATLAQAMQAVARGDFSRQAPVMSRDEIGVLTESFNSMPRQLDDARRVLEANRTALEAGKR